jgi:hypothetical protein
LTLEMLPPLMPTTSNIHDSPLPLRDLNEENRRVLTVEQILTISRIAGDPIARVGYSPEAAAGARPVRRLSAESELHGHP